MAKYHFLCMKVDLNCLLYCGGVGATEGLLSERQNIEGSCYVECCDLMVSESDSSSCDRVKTMWIRTQPGDHGFRCP